MRTSIAFLSAIALVIFNLPASAQTAHSWVASYGSDAGSCARLNPCATFSFAYGVTSTGGVISVVDSGDFGGLNIQKSLTIRGEGVDAGAVSDTATGYFISINGASSDVITLEGLHFSGAGIQVAGQVSGGGSVFVRNCVIRNNNSPASGFFNVYGIKVVPAGLVTVVVSDTVVQNNGNSGGGAGIYIVPPAGGRAQVTLDRVLAQGNQFGVAVDGSQSTGGVNMTIRDSVLASNKLDGLVATTSSGGAPIGVVLANSTLSNNGFGIRAIGSNVVVRVEGSKIAGNTGSGVSALSGGSLLSFGNNAVRANGTDGVFSGPVALQ